MGFLQSFTHASGTLSGQLPKSLRGALITLLFKKGDRTDYKLCARALAGRLLGVLQYVVHPDQSCGVWGRYIGENVVLLRGIINYAKESDTAGAILSLDQEKAFDRVDWGFLFRTLSHCFMGPVALHWSLQ